MTARSALSVRCRDLLALALGLLLAACGSEPEAGRRAAGLRPVDATTDIARAVEIFAEIRACWQAEAIRMCREQAAISPDAPMPHLMMALATAPQPNRAARCCWEAVRRRENGSAFARALVDALQAYFAVDRQPELVDARFSDAPSAERAAALRAALAALAAQGVDLFGPTERALLQELIDWDLGRAGPPRPGPTLAEWRARLRNFNAYLDETGAIPSEVPGYRRVVQRVLALEANPETIQATLDPAVRADEPRLARIPRHPEQRETIAGERPGASRTGSDEWQPRRANRFELPSGQGGMRAFAPGDDPPTLLVFFLGFGCSHCVAQLQDLDPRAAAFRDAGIEVVSIGTDSLQQVLAARQVALENGVDPLHFDVLCDPEGEVFKQWGAWDALADEALHGTFLVDAEGRILWRDISERPFEQADWLLEECNRLLRAWR